MKFPDPDREKQFQAVQATAQELIGIADLAESEEKLATLEGNSADPNLWDDADKAREVLQSVEQVRSHINKHLALQNAIDDIEVLLEMGADDPESLQEAVMTLDKLQASVNALELERLFSGEHDRNNVIMEINSGAGGTESQDWVEMLLRMYYRWAERKGFKVELLSELRGEEAGYKNVALRIVGDYAYGQLRSENGVHRLVRLSPYDSANRRHTSFASVFSMPELDDELDTTIDEKELRIDTYRASGAGGQHVNKTDSAVRITHEPTNIVVQCQNDRSQHKNRATAMKMLQSKLFELRERERQAELDAMGADKQEIGWGSQIRSYVLHPYKMVKDHRTNHEVGNAEKVLDGDLDSLTDAYLRWDASRGS